jgi:hypothetical protein
MDGIPEQQESTEHLPDFSDDDTASQPRRGKYPGRRGDAVPTGIPAGGLGLVPGIGIDRNEYSDEGDWDQHGLFRHFFHS